MINNKGCYTLAFVLIPIVFFAQDENWIYRFNGSANSVDQANSIVYGADGNIYTAGSCYMGGSNEDIMIISLTINGDTNWTYQYTSPGSFVDRAYSIAYGADSNLYVAGCFDSTTTSSNLVVISMTTAGDTNWTYKYNGPGNGFDCAYSIVYGADGNIYTAGYSTGNNTYRDFTVISLTTAGDTNWVYRYNGSADQNDEAKDIAYGSNGNIYIAGYSYSATSDKDFLVVSLSQAGNVNWIYRYSSPGNLWDQAYSVAYGGDGKIYAAGSSWGSTSLNFTVISLSFLGDTNWTYHYNGPGDYVDEARSIIYGSDGNIYAAGYSNGGSTSSDFTVISLNVLGDTNWTYRYNGSMGDYYDEVHSLDYGANGNIYAAGFSHETGTYKDFTVISLARTGHANWIYCYDGPASSNDEAYSVVYGLDGNIYTAGYSAGLTTGKDFTVISLPPDLGVMEQKTIAREDIFKATVIAGPLSLPEKKICRIFDVTGRIIIPDKITPGIYFIEIDNRIVQKVIKLR